MKDLNSRLTSLQGEVNPQIAQFLVTSVNDEGIYESSFVVVEAPSRVAIAQHMLDHPEQWEVFLRFAYKHAQPRSAQPAEEIWPMVTERSITAEELVVLLDQTLVDGDSEEQVRIGEITTQLLETVETDPWKRRNYRSPPVP